MYATYTNSHSHLKERALYSPLGGGSTDVELLSNNHCNINLTASEDLLLNEGVVPLLWIASYTTSLSWIDPQLTIMIGQSWCSSKSVLASSYTAIFE